MPSFLLPVAALSTTLSTAALDKHPQSKERGITLDLGFSAFTVVPFITCTNGYVYMVSSVQVQVHVHVHVQVDNHRMCMPCHLSSSAFASRVVAHLQGGKCATP